MVQSILNELDSDEVNSINDTVESSQVALILQSCYDELSTNRNWPHQKRVMQLNASNDLTKPNYLQIPENVKELILFKYEKSKDTDPRLLYQDVTYLYPDEFLHLIQVRDNTKSDVDVITDFNGTELLIINNIAPTYWTSFNDVWMVCDSYDKNKSDTLLQSKTQIVCYLQNEFILDDDVIPDMPAEAFPLLIEEAKSVAFLTLKQMANPKAEQKASRQQRWLSRKAWKAKGGIRYDNYGRKGNK